LEKIYLVYACAALFGIIIVETIYLLAVEKKEQRRAINRRMTLAKTTLTQEDVLKQLRKERGIQGKNFSFLPLRALKQLRIQSGIKMALPMFVTITTSAACILAVLYAFKTGKNFNAICLFFILCPILPFMTLRFMRKKRHKIFAVQLPEALDLITRGLRAGHPVPVALMMVGREMPDPVGTEFGIVADEITYGSDIVTALKALFERVGQEDLPLFVTAVSIQSSTGGNLREILDGLSYIIRERGKLRRKIRAISSEGRASAMILTAIPCLLMLIFLVFLPDYYGEAWQYEQTYYYLYFVVGMIVVANMIMSKLTNFKY
jgi:tight adherence protein B